MDLNSLPNECLVVILKNLGAATLIDVRKQNRRIDLVFKGYHLKQRALVQVLCLHVSKEYHGRYSTWNFDMYPSLYKSGRSRYKNISFPSQTTFVEKLDEYLKKIDITEVLDIKGYSFNYQTLNIFHMNKASFRFVTELRIPLVFNTLSAIDLRTIVSLLPRLEVFEIGGADLIDNFCNEKWFHQRKWRTLRFKNSRRDIDFHFTGIDNNFLFEVIRNCTNFTTGIGCEEYTNITVSAILQLFESLFATDKGVRVWAFPYVKLGSDITLEEAEERFRSVPGFDVEFERKVRVKKNPLRHISFIHCRCFRFDAQNGMKLLSFKIYEDTKFVED